MYAASGHAYRPARRPLKSETSARSTRSNSWPSAVPRPSGTGIETTGSLGDRIGFERLFGSALHIRRNGHFHGDQEVALTAGTLRHAAPADPQDTTVRRPLRHPDTDLAVQGRNGKRCP